MCGHAIIALGRFLVDTHDPLIFPRRSFLHPDPLTGMVSLNIQAPCGLVRTFVQITPTPVFDAHPTSNAFKSDPSAPVRFLSVPSFCVGTDLSVTLPLPDGPLTVTFDLAFGGAFYCILPATQLGLPSPSAADTPNFFSTHLPILRSRAALLSRTVAADPRFTSLLRHPDRSTNGDLDFLYGTIVTDNAGDAGSPLQPSLNACIFAGVQVDRSPCGSGVSARVAAMHARKKLALGETRLFGGMFSRAAGAEGGGYFEGSPVKEVKIGGVSAVVVEVAGRAWYTGVGGFVIEEKDALGEEGFLIRDVVDGR